MAFRTPDLSSKALKKQNHHQGFRQQVRTKKTLKIFLGDTSVSKKKEEGLIAYIYIYLPFWEPPICQEFFLFAVSFVKNACISPKKRKPSGLLFVANCLVEF